MTTVLRRFAWHLLGAAIGLALILVVSVAVRFVVPHPPLWLDVVAAVAAAAALSWIPGVRDLEVTAARTMLATTAELLVPARANAGHRARTAAWVVLHLTFGLAGAAALFALVPAAVLVGVETVTGRPLTGGVPVFPVEGSAARVATVLGCVLLAVVAMSITYPLGIVARGFAARFLGPTPSDRTAAALTRVRREAERIRLARELHDGLGHALTIIGVQAAAGARTAATDPVATAAALTAVADTARGAVAELDGLLAVLRADQSPGTDALHGVGIDDVVAAHRRTGMDLTAQIDLPADLTALLRGSVQRIATEALTNAHRHGGPGPVLVRVTTSDDDVVVEAVNPLRPGQRARAGHGLDGVRERVALFGGEVSAGPHGDRWVLRATLPREVRP